MTERKYYPALDYLRFVLATIVAAGHSGLITWSSSGNYAVQIFFALSGWLIGGILLGSSPEEIPQFYFNRAARIWIPYFISILLLMAASILKEPITRKWIEIFFYDITFVYNWFGPPQLAAAVHQMPLDGTGNHFWSICTEEQFYLIAPFLIILLPIGRTIWFWLAITACALASPFSGYFASISLGVLASVVNAKFGNWHARFNAILFIAAAALAISVFFELAPYKFAAPLSAISIVLVLAQPGDRSSRIGEFLGGISYPLYLNQWIGFFISNSIFGKLGLRDSLSNRIAGALISIIVAAALYLIVDRNIRKHRSRYFTTTRGIAISTIGFGLVAIGMTVALLLYGAHV